MGWNNRAVTDPTSSTLPAHDPDWWQTAVIYQIYPRAFADANGDGMGDLLGVVSRVDYLAELGVDAVWLSPFYPSALADGGYDVDDYRDVDPGIGTLADFDVMITALHGVGIKVLVDIVPNHSSDRHAWFVEALAAPAGSPERHRYIFRDGEGPDGSRPPNDWQSLFGGSVWEPVGDGQWYFHLFAPEQPDLNWDDEEVREDFRTTLRFWADRGVDGFRVDVAHGLVKDLTTPYVPWPEIEMMQREDGSHPLWDRDDLQLVYRDWRALFDSYDPPRFAVAEASVHPSRRARYAAPTSLGPGLQLRHAGSQLATRQLPDGDRSRPGRHARVGLDHHLAARLSRHRTGGVALRAAGAGRRDPDRDRPPVAAHRRHRSSL